MRTPLPYVIFKGTKVFPGHPCHVKSSEGKKDGYDTLVRGIHGDPVRKTPIEIDVIDHYTGGMRTYPMTRIQPYVRNLDKIKQRILDDRRKKLGYVTDDGGSNGAGKRRSKTSPKNRR